MAETTSGPASSVQDFPVQAASDADPPTNNEARRAALSHALLQILTEGRDQAEDSESSVSNFSDAEFRDRLADFIEMSNKEINELKDRVSRLEALIKQ